MLVDPSGALTMRERVCPLDQTLTKFGEAVPGPQNLFSLDDVSLGGQPVAVHDRSATSSRPHSSSRCPDQDKLSRPSFEDRDAGFSIGDGLVTFGQGFGLDLAFEDVYVDDKAPPPPSNPILPSQPGPAGPLGPLERRREVAAAQRWRWVSTLRQRPPRRW